MPKARHIDQLAFDYEAPRLDLKAGALAGLDVRCSRMVGEILNSDRRDRTVIAAEMSVLLEDEIGKTMLDAYAAPGKGDHNISLSRALGLIAVTQRHDLLDPRTREIGAAVLVGEEIHAARLGHLKSKIAELTAEMKAVERMAQPIRRGRN